MNGHGGVTVSQNFGRGGWGGVEVRRKFVVGGCPRHTLDLPLDLPAVGALDIPGFGHAGERLEQFGAFRIIRKSVVLRDNAEVSGELEYTAEEIE